MSRGKKSFSSSVTDNWEKAFFNSIGHYITLINKGLGKSFRSEPLSNHIKIVGGFAFKNAEYKSYGIPIIRISDFNNERIILDNVVYYEESPLLEKYELKESDIIIALTGGTIGKLGIVQAGLGKLYLNQRVGKFDILNSEEFEKEYIYWIARGVEGIVKNLAWGAAIPNVSPKQIEELNFPIPTKDIQKSIIRFLNDLRNGNLNREVAFNEEIENEIKEIQKKQVKAREIQDELSDQLTQIENLNQAILQEAVQGKLTASWRSSHPELVEGSASASELLKRIKAEKEGFGLKPSHDKALNSPAFKDRANKKEKPLPPIKPEEIPFEIPESWVWCRLGEISFNVEYGTSQKAEMSSAHIPVLRMNNIQSGQIDYENLKYVSSSIDDLPRLYLKQGDLLFNRTNSYELVGKTAIYDGIDNKMTFASYLIRVQFNNMIDSKFISSYINSPICRKTQLEPDIIQQNGQANFNGTKLKNILIPLPPLSEQIRIVTEIENQFSKIKQLKEHIISNQQATEQLLKALLHQAFEVEETVMVD